jgi:hypothetical protein
VSRSALRLLILLSEGLKRGFPDDKTLNLEALQMEPYACFHSVLRIGDAGPAGASDDV